MPQEGIFEAARDDRYFHSVAVLFGKKKRKEKRSKDGRRNIGNYIAAEDVIPSWKTAKRMCLYSTDA